MIVKVNGISFEMILVKGGSFHYGPEEGKVSIEDTYPGEWDPVVDVHEFLIGQTQITEELWDLVMLNRHNSSQLPIRNISWKECQSFIKKLNELTGKKFRLPFEPEWEYAARGGNKSNNYLYSGSNIANEVAVFNNFAPKAVMSKLPNELGIYDMSGNVWEWCENWFESRGGFDQYDAYVSANEPEDIQHVFRVYRGGGYDTNMKCTRPYTSIPGTPDYRRSSLGFRLVLDTENTIVPKPRPGKSFVYPLEEEYEVTETVRVTKPAEASATATAKTTIRVTGKGKTYEEAKKDADKQMKDAKSKAEKTLRNEASKTARKRAEEEAKKIVNQKGPDISITDLVASASGQGTGEIDDNTFIITGDGSQDSLTIQVKVNSGQSDSEIQNNTDAVKGNK